MEFVRHILRFFVVMLISVCGANMAFAVPMTASKISFFQSKNAPLTQSQDVGFAARAPPFAVSNVAVTGGSTVKQGGAFAVRGQETVATLFRFDADQNPPTFTASWVLGHVHPMFSLSVTQRTNLAMTPQQLTD